MREKQEGEMQTAWIPLYFLKKVFTVGSFDSATLIYMHIKVFMQIDILPEVYRSSRVIQYEFMDSQWVGWVENNTNTSTENGKDSLHEQRHEGI